LGEKFIVEWKIIVEISVNFRSLHSEKTIEHLVKGEVFISDVFFLIRRLLIVFMATQMTLPDGRINIRKKVDRKLCQSRNSLSPAIVPLDAAVADSVATDIQRRRQMEV
jgi:hypothetical protein